MATTWEGMATVLMTEEVCNFGGDARKPLAVILEYWRE